MQIHLQAGTAGCRWRGVPAIVQKPAKPIPRHVLRGTADIVPVPDVLTTPPTVPGTLKAFKRLQNGSDIRGVALETSPGSEITLSPAAAYFIGIGFAKYLHKHPSKMLFGAKTVVGIGRDPRLSGELLESAVALGLVNGQVDEVVLCGLATTPAMFLFSQVNSCDDVGSLAVAAGIMLTASHMPFQNNGLKFFTAQGGLGKQDISQILQYAAEACYLAGVSLANPLACTHHLCQAALASEPGATSREAFLPTYAAHLRRTIKRGVAHKEHYSFPLLGLKIVVDAGNGSGGFFATQVLQPLGAEIAGSQFLEPDGTFPNHIPNPEHPSAMAAAVAMVKASGADLGVVFDTDVDRAAIVDQDGRPINSNRMIALVAAISLREHPGTTVVTDSVTSDGLTAFIEGLGGKHLRFKRGYKNVIDKGQDLVRQGEACQLMMETSGHGALAENDFLDDGAYLAIKVVIEVVRRRVAGEGDLSALLAPLKEPAESGEYRIKIKTEDFKAAGGAVLQQFDSWLQAGAGGASHWTLEPVNYEGWRVAVDEGEGRRGWLLLRQSLHDPLLVLNIESDVAGGEGVIMAHFLRFVEGLGAGHKDGLDLSALLK